MCTSGSDDDTGWDGTDTGGGTTTGTTTGGGDGTPGDTTVSCSPIKAIRGWFNEQAVRCGDATTLVAQGINISEGSIVGFEVFRGRDNSTLDSVADVMFSQQSQPTWYPKQPLDARPGDVFFFNVSADGETGASTNYFQFRIMPNYGPDAKSWRCTSGRYGWDAKFDIWFTDDKVYVSVKIKLIQWYGDDPEHPGNQAPAVSDENKAFLKNDIEPRLSNQLFLNRTNCPLGDGCTCTKPVIVIVSFVESGEHHQVNYYQGEFRADSGHWPRVRYSAPMWAHEVGHLLGWYDEYQPDGANGPPPRWKPDEPANLMNSGSSLPAEYGWDFRDWLAGKTGEPWTVT
jgi:hypothetical protein